MPGAATRQGQTLVHRCSHKRVTEAHSLARWVILKDVHGGGLINSVRQLFIAQATHSAPVSERHFLTDDSRDLKRVARLVTQPAQAAADKVLKQRRYANIAEIPKL